MKNKIKNLIFFGIFMLFLGGCTPFLYVSDNTQMTQPAWAPDYDNMGMVHYYYFPDWGMYYDVRASEYVYMEDGNWLFSPLLPGMYSSYDLNNAYVIGLDYRVHEPWMHHTLYSSHYPPYYYKSYYANDNMGSTRIRYPNNDGRNIRGFNENDKNPFYLKRTGNARETPNKGSEPNLQRNPVPSNPSNTNMRERELSSQHNTNIGQPQQPATVSKVADVNKNVIPQQRTTQPRRALPVIYDRSTIGRPVKVNKNMMPPRNTSKVSSPRPSSSSNKRESN